MPGRQTPTVLAEAADVLSDQLRIQLIHLAELTAPHAERLELRFLSRLRKQRLSSSQQTALIAITIGAAAKTMTNGGSHSSDPKKKVVKKPAEKPQEAQKPAESKKNG